MMNMRVYISTDALKDQGLTLQDFGILLYYMGGGRANVDPVIGDKLWEKNLLVKEVDGYSYNGCRNKEIQEWFEQGISSNKEAARQFGVLADKLRALYPEGKKAGTGYMWRDSTLTIARKLKSLEDMCKDYGIPVFTDEEAIEATKKYVDSFNGDYTYMQLLKYFILKQNNDKLERASQLLSFIQNKHVEEEAQNNYEFGEMI